ncbi:MAG: nucleotidyltransferase family protein [Robiginitomaculum sp.]|nr:nucleotidyltransferase family protein [Robiginitomaculum sp.]MDQ7076974.1 nucleotidyltransferase family protein [Robiginitomaculum sp.]
MGQDGALSGAADHLRFAKVSKAAQRREFIRLARANPVNVEILKRIPDLPLPQGMLVSGCLYQSVWNGLLGHDPMRGIRDYDLIYFDDSDLSYEAEDKVIRECAAAFADLGVEVEVRNQARVHLWFKDRFGFAYTPLNNAAESLTRYMCPCHAVAIEPGKAETPILHAPYGLNDVFGFIVRPRPGQDGISASSYTKKATRMKQLWPELTIQPLSN